MLTKDMHAQPVGKVVNRSTFGFGIWKSVYLLPMPAPSAPVITQLVSHTFYAGGHPTTMLTDSDHKGFRLEATVELFTLAAGGSGTLAVLGDWPGATQESTTLSTLPAGTSNTTITLAAAQTVGAKLWQPHGHGAQNRYTLTATFTPSSTRDSAATPVSTSRKIGFRHVALVTINDTDAAAASTAATTDGTGQFTMFFRVNGAAVYARGGNKIPMDLLDGRMSAVAHRRLVQSAVEGNFNTMRVW
jgi:beta-galactosidase/beta-glucuronidase